MQAYGHDSVGVLKGRGQPPSAVCREIGQAVVAAAIDKATGSAAAAR